MVWARVWGEWRGNILVSGLNVYTPPGKMAIVCIYVNQESWKCNWGLSSMSPEPRDVLIMVPLARESNEILLFSFLLLCLCCWTIQSSQIPCNKFSNKVSRSNLATTVIGCWCGQNTLIGVSSPNVIATSSLYCCCGILNQKLFFFFKLCCKLIFYVLFCFDF